jgi:hypothetical protein
MDTYDPEENNLGSGNEVVKIRATFGNTPCPLAFCFEVAVLTHVLLTKWFGILDTPDVGCKQGLVEAHDIIEQDVTTQTYENMIKS